jgi:hypothetical protein
MMRVVQIVLQILSAVAAALGLSMYFMRGNEIVVLTPPLMLLAIYLAVLSLGFKKDAEA